MPVTTQQYSRMKICELFEDLPRSACSELLAESRPKDFASRDLIFVEGDPAKEALLLLSGRVKITQISRNGAEVILRLDLPGELIDELALEPGSTHFSTAQAAGLDCSMLAWDVLTFEELSQRFPLLQRNRLRTIERRLQELERRFCELSAMTVPRRVANMLLRLWNQIGHESNGHHQIDILQEEVAQMTATTGSTVNRLLSDWEQQGLVCRRHGSIIIRSYSGMLQLCKGPGNSQNLVS